MESVIRFIYKLALYVWLFVCGSCFVSYCFLYVAHNGLGDIFSYVPTIAMNVSIDLKKGPAVINYSYKVNQREYSGAQEVAVNVAQKLQKTEVAIL